MAAVAKAPKQQTEPIFYLISIDDVCALFNNCSRMSVYRWRVEKGLPFIRPEGYSVQSVIFELGRVEKWAKKHGYELNQDALKAIRKRGPS